MYAITVVVQHDHHKGHATLERVIIRVGLRTLLKLILLWGGVVENCLGFLSQMSLGKGLA